MARRSAHSADPIVAHRLAPTLIIGSLQLAIEYRDDDANDIADRNSILILDVGGLLGLRCVEPLVQRTSRSGAKRRL